MAKAKLSPVQLTAQIQDGVKATIGATLKQAREAREMSITELSERSGTSRTTLYNTERGLVAPDLGTLAAVGAVLGLTWLEMLPGLVAPGVEPLGGAALAAVSLSVASDPGKPVPKSAPTRVFDAETLRRAGWNEMRGHRFVSCPAPEVAWGWPVPKAAVLVVDREPNRDTKERSLWLATDGKSIGVVQSEPGAAILEAGTGVAPVLIRGERRARALGSRVVLVVSEF